jgi:hypothetical protein
MASRQHACHEGLVCQEPKGPREIEGISYAMMLWCCLFAPSSNLALDFLVFTAIGKGFQ